MSSDQDDIIEMNVWRLRRPMPTVCVFADTPDISSITTHRIHHAQAHHLADSDFYNTYEINAANWSSLHKETNFV